jgi:hypothetical protein
MPPFQFPPFKKAFVSTCVGQPLNMLQFVHGKFHALGIEMETILINQATAIHGIQEFT